MRLDLSLLALLALGLAQRAAAAEEPRAQAAPTLGRMAGTVVWAGRRPPFKHSGCDLHAWDIAGHPEVRGGLAEVAVVAEPVAAAAKQWFRERAAQGAPPAPLLWGDGVARVALARPTVAGRVENLRKRALTLDIYRDGALVRSVNLGAATEGEVPPLPEGLYQVREKNSKAEGWLLVTPFPAKISAGNCRFSFSDLPLGEYLLSGWHQRAGRVQERVSACSAPSCPIVLLTFRRPHR